MIKIYNFFKNNTIIDTFQNAITNTVAAANPTSMMGETKVVEEKLPPAVLICGIDNSNTLQTTFPDITSPQLKWQSRRSNMINVSCSNNQLIFIDSQFGLFYVPKVKTYDFAKAINIPLPAGGLTQVSFDGYNMIVMGVNSAGSVFYANKDITTKPNWTQIPGELVHISYSNNQVFGLNSAGAVFYNSNYTSDKWIKLNGILSNISFDGKNMCVMGTNKAGEIYYANETITTNPQWKKVNGGLNMVSLSNKEVYGINTPGELYYSADYTTGAWTKVGSGFKQISFDNPSPNAGAFDLTTWMAQNPDMVMYIGIGLGFLILIIIIVMVSSKRTPQYRRPAYRRPVYRQAAYRQPVYRQPAYRAAPVEDGDD
jgi:hypothetical protein